MQNMLLFAAAGMPKQLLVLSPVDWLIIAIYFAVVLGIGFYLKQFAGTGEDFFMAGRKMTAWIAGLSFISANLSALETMGWSAQTYQYGLLAAHSYWFNAVPAIIFLAMVMMPFYYICRTHSVPGYLKLRFDGRSSMVAGTSFTFMTVLVSGAGMFCMAKILHLLLELEHEREHLGRFADRGGLRHPRRLDLRGLQRSSAVLPDLVGDPAGSDPRADRRRRLDQVDADGPAQHARHPSRSSKTSASPASGGTWARSTTRWAPIGSRWSSVSASRASPTGVPTSCKCSG